MVGEPTVNEYMNPPEPYLIQINSTIKRARLKMYETGFNYLIVVEKERPAYVLEYFMTSGENADKTISEIREKLKPVTTLSYDIPFNEVVDELFQDPALVILDKEKKIIGVLSAEDFLYKQAKLK